MMRIPANFQLVSLVKLVILMGSFIDLVFGLKARGCDYPFLPSSAELEKISKLWLDVQDIVFRDKGDQIDKFSAKKNLYLTRLALLEQQKDKIVALNRELNANGRQDSVGAKKRQIREMQKRIIMELDRINVSKFTGDREAQMQAREKAIAQVMRGLNLAKADLARLQEWAAKDKGTPYLDRHLREYDYEKDEYYNFGQRPANIEDLDHLDEDIEFLKRDIKMLEKNVDRDYRAVLEEMQENLDKAEETIKSKIESIRSAPLTE